MIITTYVGLSISTRRTPLTQISTRPRTLTRFSGHILQSACPNAGTPNIGGTAATRSNNSMGRRTRHGASEGLPPNLLHTARDAGLQGDAAGRSF
jgi:hypothetical protein